MSEKYIIKNCECKVKGKTTLCVRDIPYKKCEDITDCKLKQIVEKCKNKDYFVKRFPNAEFSNAVQNSELAFDILQLLDIQEDNQ